MLQYRIKIDGIDRLKFKENTKKNKFQKDLINIDRRVGLLYSAIGGGILKIYPIPGDENNTWVSQPETSRANFTATDSVFVRQSLPVYIQFLQEAKKTNEYAKADKILEGIKTFQKKYGTTVYPKERTIALEILYNKFQPFLSLSKYYGYVSLLLIVFVITQIFYEKKCFQNRIILTGLNSKLTSNLEAL